MATDDYLPAGRSRPSDLDPSFVRRGMRFPLAIDPSGSLAFADAGESTDSAIRVVLSTAPGERVMRPAFGCRIWDLLFEPVNANTLGLMAEAVREALASVSPEAETALALQGLGGGGLMHPAVHQHDPLAGLYRPCIAVGNTRERQRQSQPPEAGQDPLPSTELALAVNRRHCTHHINAS